MAGSVNKVILIGNLGQDPEVKSFQNGGRIANLRIATSENWKDRQTGERKERTEWHTVVLQSDGLVGVAERYLRKGSKVYIEGQLRTRKWQDASGNDRYTTEVSVGGIGGVLTMLDGAPGGGSAVSRGTIVYLQRRGWRYLRNLARAVPELYPVFASATLSALPKETSLWSTIAASKIIHAREEVIENAWKLSPDPLMVLLETAQQNDAAKFAIDSVIASTSVRPASAATA